jgi:hypothetical protein
LLDLLDELLEELEFEVDELELELELLLDEELLELIIFPHGQLTLSNSIFILLLTVLTLIHLLPASFLRVNDTLPVCLFLDIDFINEKALNLAAVDTSLSTIL